MRQKREDLEKESIEVSKIINNKIEVLDEEMAKVKVLINRKRADLDEYEHKCKSIIEEKRKYLDKLWRNDSEARKVQYERRIQRQETNDYTRMIEMQVQHQLMLNSLAAHKVTTVVLFIKNN